MIDLGVGLALLGGGAVLATGFRWAAKRFSLGLAPPRPRDLVLLEAAARELGFRPPAEAPYKCSGFVGAIAVEASAVEYGVAIRAMHRQIPGGFRLRLQGEGAGQELLKALGKEDVNVADAPAGFAGEFDARFVVATTSAVLTRRILADHLDRLLPYDEHDWTLADNALTVVGPSNDADALVATIRLAAAIATSAIGLAEEWAALAKALHGSLVDYPGSWSESARLQRIALDRGGDVTLHVARDFEDDRILLSPIPRGEDAQATLVRAGYTLDLPLAAIALPANARGEKLEAALEALAVANRGEEPRPYR